MDFYTVNYKKRGIYMSKYLRIFGFLIIALILMACVNTDDVGETYEVKMSRAIFPPDFNNSNYSVAAKKFKKSC